ncbi:hypothetical protein C8P68_101252 [Mucilaginibacter yixingensis]|uniref:Uncharacterized protein n=1 Tax=Mucilaginibacter yixingensis TaxID=1295612 RepID=A0A2T5JF10_9SPHI|nr:hypothetical protein C8P68_101252 [Mucilaginibacter yixingensis]
MRDKKPELSLFKRYTIAALAFTATAIVFAIAIVLSPLFVLFYIGYNVFNNIKNKGNVSSNPWASKSSVSLSHSKIS